jgi:hypothetical protein
VGVYRHLIPHTDIRCRRHVHHDDRSRAYPFDTAGIEIVSAVHTRHTPILDQGQAGSCTGNAGVGALATDPLFAALTGVDTRPYSLDEYGAVRLYSDAEMLDGDGPYPPNDNGSSGLSIAKVLARRGLIGGYRHTFTLTDTLKALAVTPVLLGVTWYERMSAPDPDGRVHPGGQVAGGHEIVAREIDTTNGRVWFDNSWGAGWGVNGRGWFTFDDLGTLLADQGDAMILTPAPSPGPVPDGGADAVLVDALDPWAAARHVGGNANAATAYRAWRTAKGFPPYQGEHVG